jgi:AbrB family looped-hinge helix DNA binding protein
MEFSVITSKGQVVIPKNLRKKYNIKPGTKISFSDQGDRIIMLALTKEYYQNLAGWLKVDALTELMKEKKKEIQHDEKRYLR